ncbi:Disease resistance protein SUMM2 [Camellia lanceoleosa]|nr:Disease resistance protein SUMM2 [Camellia lanceoleosa]
MVENCVLPIGKKIGEYLAATVGRQFGYLFSYERNIENLENQVVKLKDKRFRVQNSVEEAKAKREAIAPDVERWLTSVNKLIEEATKFLEDEKNANIGCLNGWCPNLKSRYSLSRKATEKTGSVEKLLGEGDFSRVSYPTVVPSVGTTFAFTGGFKGFESRRSIMNGVMEALTDDSIYVIGICGIGGVGKTTMVNEVGKKVEEKKMFDIIVMVVVSQNPNLITIQGQIAKILDLQDFGGNNLPTGAGKIRSEILSFGRVLVILDDVWKRLELNDIGIPFGDNHKGCKIVMTSRNKDVCNSMGTHENFEIGVLHKEEAWNFFKEMAEIWTKVQVTQPGFLLTQMAIRRNVEACRLLLLQSGGHLDVKTSIHGILLLNNYESHWSKTLVECMKRKEHSIIVRCDKVLKEWPKKDRLEKKAIISLKVDGMHGLPGNLEFPNLHLLKLDCNAGLPPISLYNLNNGMKEVKVQETQDSFYQGMKELKVLALSDMYGSLTTSLRCLTNLRTLSLFGCRLIDDGISVIGALENLEILRFGDSYIKELPKEIIGHLAHLKVLDLLGCVVERIYPGVLSSLSKLEELYVGYIFESWCEVEESKEGAKAIIDELASLSNLMALDIDLIDISFWPRGLVIEKLKKFNIRVGITHDIPVRFSLSNQLQLEDVNMSDIIETRLNFIWKSTEHLTLNLGVEGMKILCDLDKLATIEDLTIYGMKNLTEIWPGELEAKLREMIVECCHGLSSILFPSNSIKGMQNLEVLEVKDCRSIGVAFDLEGVVWEGILDMALPSLKKVELCHLQKLTHVWKDNSPGIQGFQNLRSLVVNECDSLRNLFSYSLAKLLVKLQEIEVTECGMMESIIGNEPNADDVVITNIIMFPQLSSLKLSNLPNLSSFCFEACTFEGSLLKTIEVINCPKMKILPSAFQRKLDQQKANFSTLSPRHLLDGKFIFSYCHPYGFGKLAITNINGSIEMWHNQLEVNRLHQISVPSIEVLMWKGSNIYHLRCIANLFTEKVIYWVCFS